MRTQADARPAGGGDRGGQRARARRRTSSIRCSPTGRAASSTSRARRIPAKAQALEEQAASSGIGFYPEERRDYPQERSAPRGASATRASDNKGLAGLELALDKTLAGPHGEKTIVRDPFGAHARRGRREAGAGRPRRLSDDRPHAPGPGRAGARRDARAVGAKAATADRPRPADGRHARAWRSSPASTRTGSRRSPQDAAAQPRRHGHVRARLDLQGRDARAARSRPGMVTPSTKFTLAVLDPGRRPRHPRRGAARDARR